MVFNFGKKSFEKIDLETVSIALFSGNIISYAEFVELFDLPLMPIERKANRKVINRTQKILRDKQKIDSIVQCFSFLLSKENYLSFWKTQHRKEIVKILTPLIQKWILSLFAYYLTGLNKDQSKMGSYLARVFLEILAEESLKNGVSYSAVPNISDFDNWLIFRYEGESETNILIKNYRKFFEIYIQGIKDFPDASQLFWNIRSLTLGDIDNSYAKRLSSIGEDIFFDKLKFFKEQNQEIVWGIHHKVSAVESLKLGIENFSEETRKSIVGF